MSRISLGFSNLKPYTHATACHRVTIQKRKNKKRRKKGEKRGKRKEGKKKERKKGKRKKTTTRFETPPHLEGVELLDPQGRAQITKAFCMKKNTVVTRATLTILTKQNHTAKTYEFCHLPRKRRTTKIIFA